MLYFVSNLLGGQKSANKNNLIAKSNDSALIRNCIFSTFGLLAKRPGTTLIGAQIANSDILGAHDLGKADGTHKWLAVNTDKIYYYKTTAPTGWTDSGVTGLTTGKRTRFTNFVNRVFFVNGTQAVKDWDGATTYDNNVVGAPIANYINTFYDRIYTNDTTDKSLIRYTTVPTASVISWNSGDYGSYQVQENDGDIITGIHPRRDRLLIFKNHYIEGRDSYFRRISVVRGLGTPCNDSVVTINNSTFFLNLDDRNTTGIYEYSTSDPIKISSPIQDVIDSIDFSDLTKFWAVKFSDNYLINFGSISSVQTLGLYNTNYKAWATWQLPYTIKICSVFTDSNSLYPFFGTSTGKVYESIGAKDGSDAINSEVDTWEIHCDKPHLFKEFSKIVIFCQSPVGSEVEYRIDGGDWISCGAINKKTWVGKLVGKGYVIEVRIRDSSVGEFDLKGFLIEYNPEEEIRII